MGDWELPRTPKGPLARPGSERGVGRKPKEWRNLGSNFFSFPGSHNSAGQALLKPVSCSWFCHAMPCHALPCCLSCQFSPSLLLPPRPKLDSPDSCPLKGQKASMLLLCVVVFPQTVRKQRRSEQRCERSSAFLPSRVRRAPISHTNLAGCEVPRPPLPAPAATTVSLAASTILALCFCAPGQGGGPAPKDPSCSFPARPNTSPNFLFLSE